MKIGSDDTHCIYTSQVLVFMLEIIKSRVPDITLEQSLVIVNEIVTANFPKCLDKYLKNEEWKL
jgi:hypothetical protein